MVHLLNIHWAYRKCDTYRVMATVIQILCKHAAVLCACWREKIFYCVSECMNSECFCQNGMCACANDMEQYVLMHSLLRSLVQHRHICQTPFCSDKVIRHLTTMCLCWCVLSLSAFHLLISVVCLTITPTTNVLKTKARCQFLSVIYVPTFQCFFFGNLIFN